MAALSALRNRNSQKMREGFETFLAKCVETSEKKNEVDLIYVVNTMEENNIKLEQKETSRLEKICDNQNKINRYMKLSSSGPGPGPRSGPGQVPGQVQKVQGLRSKNLDLI